MDTKNKYSQLQVELAPFKKALRKASDIIMDKEVSDYPIFIVHQQEIELGIPIIDSKSYKSPWNIHASSLEEFVSKQIIFEEKVEEFKISFKDPYSYLCLFVLSELGAKFIYLPRM